MSWLERAAEQRLAEAADAGELDVPAWRGRPLPDLDRVRQPGWWADRFVRRELSRDRRQVALAAAERARAGFWRASDVGELRERVREANRAIARANLHMVADDRLAPFDDVAVEARWREVRRPIGA